MIEDISKCPYCKEKSFISKPHDTLKAIKVFCCSSCGWS